MSGKPRKRRLPRLQGPIANGAIRGTCYVHKPLVYGRTQWTVRMEGVDRVPAAFKRRRTYAGFLADKHAQAAAAAGPEGGRRSEGGSNGDGVGHGEDGEDGKGASAAFLANKRGQAAAAVPEEGRPSEGGGNADGGGNSAAAEDGKDGKQELTAAQEPQGDAGAPDEHDGDGKPRPAAMQEPQSTTPEEDFWAQHGQRYAWLVRAIRSSWPAPKGGRRGLVSQLSGDFMFSFLSLAHARLKTCPGCCPDEHAGAPRYQRQPGSPDTVIYSAVEGRIVANLPAYCCDKCGAKSIVYPVTAGAAPSHPAVYYSIGLLAMAHPDIAREGAEAFAGALQQVHLKNKCAEGGARGAFRHLGLAAEQWDQIGEFATEFWFAQEPVTPSTAAKVEAAGTQG